MKPSYAAKQSGRTERGNAPINQPELVITYILP